MESHVLTIKFFHCQFLSITKTVATTITSNAILAKFIEAG